MKRHKHRKLSEKINLSRCIFGASVCALIFTLGFRIHSAGSIAAKSESLKILAEKKNSLEKEIALLEYEASKYSSLHYVESTANKYGFIKAVEPLVAVDLTVGSPIASAR